jgi:hypothetical protein
MSTYTLKEILFISCNLKADTAENQTQNLILQLAKL